MGAEIGAKHLNDDCLSRCLDKIAAYGTTKLYSEVAFEIAVEKDILGQRMHLDTTSFVLHGCYDVEALNDAPQPAYGYSKQKRSDLKQVMMSLTQGGVANIPLWMEPLDGNSSDKTSFHETVKKAQQFTQQLNLMPDGLCFVVDAAFYVPEKLAQLNDVHWITRVPAQLKEAKNWLKTSADDHARVIYKYIGNEQFDISWSGTLQNGAYQTGGVHSNLQYEWLFLADLGYHFDNWLVYGGIGAALFNVSAQLNGDVLPAGNFNFFSVNQQNNKSLWGGSGHVGIEYMLPNRFTVDLSYNFVISQKQNVPSLIFSSGNANFYSQFVQNLQAVEQGVNVTINKYFNF